MYQEAGERRRYREQSLSLKDFVDGLGLRVEIAAATAADAARISQLTLRTNQFNFTARRRSEAEVREFLQRPGAHCVAVRVADRFGDYGLVGVLMYESAAERCRVDTLLLSCRVLGRGVEHAARVLARQARARRGESLRRADFQFDRQESAGERIPRQHRRRLASPLPPGNWPT